MKRTFTFLLLYGMLVLFGGLGVLLLVFGLAALGLVIAIAALLIRRKR